MTNATTDASSHPLLSDTLSTVVDGFNDARLWMVDFFQNKLATVALVLAFTLAAWCLINLLVRMIRKWLTGLKVSPGSHNFQVDEVEEDDSDCEKEYGLDPTLIQFGTNLMKYTLRVLLASSVASMLGIETTSFLAIFTTSSLAIGLAVQGILKDLARGVILTLLHPFRVGDLLWVPSGEFSFQGRVVELGMFYTTLLDADGRTHIIPNSEINVITNITGHDSSRVDLTARVGRLEDINRVKAMLLEVASSEKHMSRSQPPKAFVSRVSEDAVEYVLQVWVRGDDSDGRTKACLREKVLQVFVAQNITFLSLE